MDSVSIVKEIYFKCKSLNIKPMHIAQVAIYIPKKSNVLDFINDGIRTILMEANLNVTSVFETYFKGSENISLYPVAAYYKNGTISLYQRAGSTFIGDIGVHPAIINDYYKIADEDKFEVETKKFSAIDDGTIELLSVGIERAEWYVMQELISRPTVISEETHSKYYIKPELKELKAYMDQHGYIIWQKKHRYDMH